MKAEKLGAMAANAMACMLSTTIKPGLMDRQNCGSDENMDFLTVLTGIRVLTPWFIEIARQSINSSHLSPTGLFSQIRGLGVKAERDMFKATRGVNTFKGALFCVAVCEAAAGRVISGMMYPDSNTVCVVAAEMAQGLCQRELETLDLKVKLIGEDSLSQGERMYIKYKATGARGEAQGGFSTVKRHALPVLRKLTADKKYSQNDVYVQTFLTLMANTADTGVLAQESDLAVLEIQDRAKGILERGGVTTPLGREKISKLDSHLIERRLPPKASAALLATAIFLNTLDEEAKNNTF